MKVLIIDDEEGIAKILSKFIQQEGHEAFSALTAQDGLDRAEVLKPDVILLDLNLPDMKGLDVLTQINERKMSAQVVMITGEGSVDSAVQAMKMGAEDYLEKPLNVEKLKIVIKKIAEKQGLLREVSALKKQRRELYRKDYLFLTDPEMQKIYDQIEQVAQQDKVTALILGETGTGKEHIAKLIHALSPRASQPFVELHCGALPETILESELFGYEPGAFTDARKQKRGLFEEAQFGSIFLDEIGELTPAVQTKLLKVLEQKTVRHLGGNREIPLDVRIIAATHRTLEKEVQEGRFRADLFYRLNVIPLTLPPLRERPGDVEQLANFFFKEACQVFGKKLNLLSSDIMEKLRNHHWPGNVRELKHVIERMVITSKGQALTVKDLPKEIMEAKKGASGSQRGSMTKEDAERENIQKALVETNGNQSRAAEKLGVTRKTLFNKIKKYGLKLTE